MNEIEGPDFYGARFEVAGSPVHIVAYLVGEFIPQEGFDDVSPAKFAVQEIVKAREFFNSWPSIHEEVYHFSGEATFVIVGRTFASAGTGLHSECVELQYSLRQRGDGEIPAFSVM